MNVPQFILQVVYNGKDISGDIKNALVSARYKDNISGKLDEIEIVLEDSELHWQSDWYPQKGDTMTVQAGDVNKLLKCGTFKIDEVEISAPPNTVSIRGVSLNITGKMRSKRSVAHENKTLAQIAQSIAADNGLTVQGTIPPIIITRETQANETDLAFLRRISDEYGIMFNVRDNTLIFTTIFEIENQPPVISIDATDVISYRVVDKSFASYKGATVSYHNPKTKKRVNYTVETVNNADGVTFNRIASNDDGMNATTPTPKTTDGKPYDTGTPAQTGDNLLITSKTENDQQATQKATAALQKHNSKQQEGSVHLPGNPYLVAGNNFMLTGIGALTGNYHIMSSDHAFSKSDGWTIDLEIKRVGYLQKVKQPPKKPRKKKAPIYKTIK